VNSKEYDAGEGEEKKVGVKETLYNRGGGEKQGVAQELFMMGRAHKGLPGFSKGKSCWFPSQRKKVATAAGVVSPCRELERRRHDLGRGKREIPVVMGPMRL